MTPADHPVAAPRRRLALRATLVVLSFALLWTQAFRSLHNEGGDARWYAKAAEFLLSGSYWQDTDWNTWPPFFALFVVPVALLFRAVSSPIVRNTVLFAANLALTALYVRVSVSGVARRPSVELMLGTALVCAPFLRANFWFHQINLVPALATALAFDLAGKRGDSRLAGALLGFAASLKVTPVTLLPWLWGRWRALAMALGTGVLCALLPAVVYGPGTLVDATAFWVTKVLPVQPGARGFQNASLPGCLHRFFDAQAGEVVPGFRTLVVDLGPRVPEIVGTGLGFALLGGGYVLVKRGIRRAPMLDLALLGPLGTLAATVAWRHHFILLVPTAAALLAYLGDDRAEPRRRRLVGVLAGLALAFDLAQETGAFAAGRIGDAVYCYGVSTWAVMLACAALAAARADATSEAWKPMPALPEGHASLPSPAVATT